MRRLLSQLYCDTTSALGELGITAVERFRSPTATKWGELEATAFWVVKSSEKRLQFDLSENLRSAGVLHPPFFSPIYGAVQGDKTESRSPCPIWESFRFA